MGGIHFDEVNMMNLVGMIHECILTRLIRYFHCGGQIPIHYVDTAKLLPAISLAFLESHLFYLAPAAVQLGLGLAAVHCGNDRAMHV